MTDIIPTGVLKKHFPNITDYQLYLKRRLFIPVALTAGELTDVIQLKDVEESLKRIERSVNDLSQQYRTLPLSVLLDEPEDLGRRIRKLQYDLTGKYIHIEDTFPPKEVYISKVFKKAQGKPTIGHKARVSELPAKNPTSANLVSLLAGT